MEDIKVKPVNNILSEIVYNIKGNDVITTIVNGKILMENRKMYCNNEKEIFSKCTEIIERIQK